MHRLEQDKANSDAKIEDLEKENAKLKEEITSYQDSLDEVTEFKDEIFNEWMSNENEWTSQEKCYKSKIRMLEDKLKQQEINNKSVMQLIYKQHNREMIKKEGEIAYLQIQKRELKSKLNKSKRETKKWKREAELASNTITSIKNGNPKKRRRIKH